MKIRDYMIVKTGSGTITVKKDHNTYKSTYSVSFFGVSASRMSELYNNPLNIKKMEKKVIKLRVDKDVTSCAQLRMREKSDPDWTDFVCGIDVENDIVLTTYYHLWGRSFSDLARNIIETCRRFDRSEFSNLDNIIELIICDDSQALQTGIDYDDPEYFEKCDKITQKCRAELAKNPKAFYGLTQNDDGDWEGTVEIYI